MYGQRATAILLVSPTPKQGPVSLNTIVSPSSLRKKLATLSLTPFLGVRNPLRLMRKLFTSSIVRRQTRVSYALSLRAIGYQTFLSHRHPRQALCSLAPLRHRPIRFLCRIPRHQRLLPLSASTKSFPIRKPRATAGNLSSSIISDPQTPIFPAGHCATRPKPANIRFRPELLSKPRHTWLLPTKPSNSPSITLTKPSRSLIQQKRLSIPSRTQKPKKMFHSTSYRVAGPPATL